MNKTVLIAGLGLIGGSIAKAISRSNDHYVIGYDKNVSSSEYALANNIIDVQSFNFEQTAQQADIIILAVPISETIRLMKKLDQVSFDKEVIVTDVSSVKGSIIQTANELTNPNITFIGGHPMAGSHKTGIQAAREHLFENAIYILTPTKKCSEKQVEILKKALTYTKSHFIILEPEEHDEMTSVISHFPHLIASSLVHQARKWEKKHAYIPELAAGGFRDITRIASSNPEMWQDIFHHNGHKMCHLLDDWITEMHKLKEVLVKNNKKAMISYLQEAKNYRDGLDQDRRGAIPSFYDLYVDIKDQPGALALVVQILAVKEINITNIQILEIREGINGALRITVPTKEAQEKSKSALEKHGYEVMIQN